MSISFVSASSANGTTLSLPTHAADDLILMGACRNNTTAQITIPDGWAFLGRTIASSLGTYICWKFASNSSESSGTWSDSHHLSAMVYRPASGFMVVPARFAGINDNTGDQVRYSAIASASTHSSVWHAAFAGIRSNDTDIETPPSGMVFRTGIAGASAGELAGFDTNSNNASWPLTAVTLTTGTFSSRAVVVAELLLMSRNAGGVSGLSPSLINSQALVRGIVI